MTHYATDYQRLRPAGKAEDDCLNPYCEKKAVASGYCNTHYKRIARGMDPDAPRMRRQETPHQIAGPRFSAEQYEFLKTVALERDKTVYALVQEIIEDWVTTAQKIRGAPKRK
jgi:hypothetical protein